MTTELNPYDIALDRLNPFGSVTNNLGLCLRPTIITRDESLSFVWGDWAAIEARFLPWLSGERAAEATLNVFRESDVNPLLPDNYIREASRIYGRPAKDILEALSSKDSNEQQEAAECRTVGKVAVLGLGYGGATGALMAQAHAYGLSFTEERAQNIVNIWRDANPWAMAFWQSIMRAFESAFAHPQQSFPAGRVKFRYEPSYLSGSMFCRLPCGRVLTYPGVRQPVEERGNWSFAHLVGSTIIRKPIWYGLLCENVTQACAGSLLRGKLVEFDEAYKLGDAPVSFKICGHTHDEILGETPTADVVEACAYVKSVMGAPFKWCESVPLACEVKSHWYYTKARG